MCQFVSWIEKDGKNYFLTANQIFNTTRGKALQKYCGSTDDYVGHGAIREYYHLAGGIERECPDFSSPDNFPDEIAKAIKDGKFRGLAVARDLLSKPAWAEYLKVERPAYAEYEKVKQVAYAEYLKVERPAFWDLFAIPENRKPAWR